MTRLTMPPVLVPLAVAVAVAVPACGSGDGEEGERDGARSTTTDPPETTTTTVATEGPEEWVAVARDVYARLDALLADPQPERVRELFAETCGCYDNPHNNVKVLADAGWHIEGEPTTVLAVEYQSPQPAGGFTGLVVEGQFHPYEVVDDETGEVVDESPGTERFCELLLLVADGAGDAYRVHGRVDPFTCPSGEG